MLRVLVIFFSLFFPLKKQAYSQSLDLLPPSQKLGFEKGIPFCKATTVESFCRPLEDFLSYQERIVKRPFRPWWLHQYFSTPAGMSRKSPEADEVFSWVIQEREEALQKRPKVAELFELYQLNPKLKALCCKDQMTCSQKFQEKISNLSFDILPDQPSHYDSKKNLLILETFELNDFIVIEQLERLMLRLYGQLCLSVKQDSLVSQGDEGESELDRFRAQQTQSFGKEFTACIEREYTAHPDPRASKSDFIKAHGDAFSEAIFASLLKNEAHPTSCFALGGAQAAYVCAFESKLVKKKWCDE